MGNGDTNAMANLDEDGCGRYGGSSGGGFGCVWLVLIGEGNMTYFSKWG